MSTQTSDIGCACACGWGGSEPYFIRQRIVTARKLHWCVECNESIEPGDRYELTNGMWDGEFGTHKTCLPCQRIRDDLCSDYTFGGLREAVMDCHGVDYITGEDFRGDEP